MRRANFFAGFAVVATLSLTTPAHADPVFAVDFAGKCTDCNAASGDLATAQLILHDYNLGDDITTGNFVSFTYNGTDLVNPFTIAAGDTNLIVAGLIQGTLPGYQDVFIKGDVNGTD